MLMAKLENRTMVNLESVIKYCWQYFVITNIELELKLVNYVGQGRWISSLPFFVLRAVP